MIDPSLQENYETLTSFWRIAADTNPYWSVATKRQFQPDQLSLDEFYADAQDDMAPLLDAVQKHCSWMPSEGLCLEFGCGAGRIAVHLSRCFREVLACDAVGDYVKITKDALERLGIGNVLVSQSELQVPVLNASIDLVYSVLVFQHMVPRMVIHYLAQLSSCLRSGGLMYFQCLVEPEAALDAVANSNGHELYGTPIEAIRNALGENRVKIVDEVPAQAYVGDRGRSIIVVAKKE